MHNPPISVSISVIEHQRQRSCVFAISRSVSSRRRTRSSGWQSVVQHCRKRDLTVTETIALLVRLGKEEGEEEQEADSQIMEADLLAPVCEI